MNKILLLLTFFLYLSPTTKAQDVVRPDVLFFRLPDLATNQANALQKGDKKQAARLAEIAKNYRSAILKDFRQNFTFCTVYFFTESELQFFAEDAWSQVTFYDNKGKVVQVEKPKQYLVANIGIKPPVYNTGVKYGEEQVKQDEINYNENSQAHDEDGIVLRDKNIEPIKGKLLFTNSFLGKKGIGFLKPNSMDYRFRGASALELKLIKAFGLK